MTIPWTGCLLVLTRSVCFACGGDAGDRIAHANWIRVEMVRQPEGRVGFVVHARPCVAERFFAWINRNRGLARDFKASIASVRLLLRRSGF